MSDIPENNKEPDKKAENNSLPFKEIDKDELESIIPELEDVEPIIDKLEPEERKQVLRAMVAISIRRTWSGPIPPPDILKAYNECFEGGAKAIFDQSKEQGDHRMKMETTTIGREQDQSGRGQNYAFILALFLFILAGFLSYTGHDAVAGIAIGFDVIGLAAVFLAGKNNIRIDISKKSGNEKDAKKDLPTIADKSDD